MVTSFQFVPINNNHPHAKYFWALEGKASKKSPYTHAIVPRGVTELLFIYKGSFKESLTGQVFRKGDLVIGAQKDILGKYILEENFGVFGVCLHPYVLPIFLSVSGTSLMNQNIMWSEVERLSSLREKLGEVESNTDRMNIVLSELFKMGKAIENYDPLFCSVVNEMSFSMRENSSIVSSRADISLRQFQRKFKNLTGYTPSQFLRISKLQYVIDSTKPDNMARLALELGYYDQSHFINDFKKITGGITPSQYFMGLEELKWKNLGESVVYFQS